MNSHGKSPINALLTACKTIAAPLRGTPLHRLWLSQFRPRIEWKRNRRELRAWSESDAAWKVFFAEFVRPGDLVFDVGANLGFRSKIFLAMEAKVVAMEPQESCVNFLRATLGSRNDFHLIAKAAGPAAGRTTMRVSGSHPISSLSPEWLEAVKKSGRFQQAEWDREQEVEITTLQDVMAEFGTPAFVKIDVEGFEAEVLAGLSAPIPALSVEFTPEHPATVEKCARLLAKLGDYECRPCFGDRPVWRAERWMSFEELAPQLAAMSGIDYADIYFRLK